MRLLPLFCSLILLLGIGICIQGIALAHTTNLQLNQTNRWDLVNDPQGIAVDSQDNVYVTDPDNYSIDEIYQANNSSQDLGYTFQDPYGIAVDSTGNIYVTASNGNDVTEIYANGSTTTLGTDPNFGGFTSPEGVAVDSQGNVYVGDNQNDAVEEICTNGTVLTIDNNTIFSNLNNPKGVAVDSQGDVFLTDTGNQSVDEIYANGQVASIGYDPNFNGFDNPVGVAVDSQGDVFVADTGNRAIVEIYKNGTVVTLGSGFDQPSGVAIAPDGNLFVLDNTGIQEFTIGGPVQGPTPGTVTDVTRGKTYPGIQAAINGAYPGDTIQATSGTYLENVKVNKTLTLIGENTGKGLPIVDGTGGNSAISVTSDHVTIQGFNVTDAQNGIVLNANYCNVTGTTADGNTNSGIEAESSGFTNLSDNTADGNTYYGIMVFGSTNATVTDNTADNDGHGIYVENMDTMVLSGNTADNNMGSGGVSGMGIELYTVNGLSMSGNSADNNQYGIYLADTQNAVLKNNVMSGNSFNYGDDWPLTNDVDTSNLADGKPIYYLRGANGYVIGPSSGAGTVYVINSSNVTVQGLTLTNNAHGVYFYNTNYSHVQGMNTSYDGTGIYLESSNNNTLSGNLCNSSNSEGIGIESSNNNTITGNTAYYNPYSGINVYVSSNNTLSGNTVDYGMNSGIHIQGGNNTVENNIADYNYEGILTEWDNTNITGNTADHNHWGIAIYSDLNNITGNTAEWNGDGIFGVGFCNNNTVSGNALDNNSMGIWLDGAANNTFTGNDIENNYYGVDLDAHAAGNALWLNVISGNYVNANVTYSDPNVWNSSAIEQYMYNGQSFSNYTGNYWGDYTGGSINGIGTAPYVIDTDDNNNTDYYPMIQSVPLTASFTANTTGGLVPLTVQFNDTSSGYPVTWNWSFGDKTANVTTQNVTHIFQASGTYSVELTVIDGSQVSTASRQIQVTAPNTTLYGPETAWSDWGKSGSIIGRVTYLTTGDVPVSGATVALVNASDPGQVYCSTTSNSSGFYVFTDVNATYSSVNLTGPDNRQSDYNLGTMMYKIDASNSMGVGKSNTFGIDADSSNSVTTSAIIPVPPVSIALTADSSSVMANGTDTVVVHAHGVDALGNPVADGTKVVFVVGNTTSPNIIWSAENGSVSVQGTSQVTLVTTNGNVSTDFGWVPADAAGSSSGVWAYYEYYPAVNGSTLITFAASPGPSASPSPGSPVCVSSLALPLLAVGVAMAGSQAVMRKGKK